MTVLARVSAHSPADFTMNNPAYLQDPYPFYAFMRESHPIFRSPMFGGSWLVFSHSAVTELATAEQLTNDRSGLPLLAVGEQARGRPNGLTDLIAPWVAFRDGADHRRDRRHLNGIWKAVTATDLGYLVLTSAAEVERRLDSSARPDFMADFARPLSASVIAGVLGLVDADLDRLGGHADDLAFAFGSSTIGLDDLDAAERSAAVLHDYFEHALRALAGPQTDSMLGRMLRAAPDGHAYSPHEAAAQCILLLFAGLTPVRHLLASAFRILDSRPALRAALQAEPGLLPAAADELLRFDTPVQHIVRICREPFTFRGNPIGRGEPVLLYSASANRDPAAFDEPDEFRLDRGPNRHLSFGHGPHYCLAGLMVRRVLVTALPVILRLLERFTTDDGQVVLNRNLGFHGYERMPLARRAGGRPPSPARSVGDVVADHRGRCPVVHRAGVAVGPAARR